jgi:hypothetical protein
MFIATLFTIVQLWKQPRNLTIDEWIKNVVFIYNGIVFSPKKSEILSFAGKWMDL